MHLELPHISEKLFLNNHESLFCLLEIMQIQILGVHTKLVQTHII